MTGDERWLDADEQAAWRGWLDTYRLLIPVLDRQLQVSRVSFTEYEVLVCLSEAADLRLRMSEVADRTLATRSAITRTVDRLVARGWVRRVRSLRDQRGAYATLTEPGARALAELAPGHVRAVRDNLIDLLTPAELDALRSIGARVRGRLAGGDGWSPRMSSAAPDPADDGAGDDGALDTACADLGDAVGTETDRQEADLGVAQLPDTHRPAPHPARPDPAGTQPFGVDTTGEGERVTTGPER